MDKLDPAQRAAVSKISTERLRIKLGKADYDEQLVSEMTREQLLEAWANCVLAGKDKPVAAPAKAPSIVGYDVELERQRLAFETKKFEAELALRQEELQAAKLRDELIEKRRREELEAAKLRDELSEQRRRDELEAAQLREAREADERRALYRLQEEELRMKQRQWEWQQSHELSEAEKRNTPAAQVKFFGNVLKNVMPKFPTDVADIPVYFEGIEKIFISFEVPTSLQAKLLLPYLSEKAKSLLLRLEQSKQDVYDEVKQFLLNEFRLTPVQFKDRFERAIRNSDETFTMFCSRLKNMLTYYFRSRHVDENYEILFSLLVADKIKTVLPETCLDHVLTAEGNSWLKCEDLASTIDTYFANHSYDGRPKTVSSFGGKHANNQLSGSFNNRDCKLTNDARSGTQTGNASGNSTNANHRQGGSTGQKPGVLSQPPSRSVLCFICQSPSHKQATCPSRVSTAGKPGQGHGTARNYACAIESQADIVTGTEDRERQATHGRVTGSNLAGEANASMRDSAAGGTRVSGVKMADVQSTPANNATGNIARAAAPTCHSVRVIVRSVDGESQPNDAMVIDSRSKLIYVGIVISNI